MKASKLIITLATLLMFSVSALAAGPLKVSGKVLDSKSGEAVAGAVVRLDGNYLWAVSDINGKFSLDGVQQGEYDMNVSCLGYVDENRRLSVKSDIKDLDIRLSISSLALEGVVVTAEKSKDNINTTQKIGRNALDHLQMSNMADISALLPGGKTINPDLTTNNVLSLRSGGSTAGNAAYYGEGITALDADGFGWAFSGIISKTSAAADGKYTTTKTSSDKCSVEKYLGKPAMSYLLGSTGFAVNKTSGNIQFFGMMSTFTSTYMEGRATVSYVGYLGGKSLRCIKNK